MKHAYLLAALCALSALGACGQNGADYPQLLPTDQLLAEPVLPAHATSAGANSAPPDAAISARADALRDRARSLKRPVIEPAGRARMDGALGS